jgi:hypothetical protein
MDIEYNNLEYNNLDDDWISNFEKTDCLYKDFYKDDLYYVNLRILYINRGNEIEKLTHEPFLMSKPNHITREEILEILKKNSTDNDKKYTLLSILKYNIILDPQDVTIYLNNENDYGNEKNYLDVVKNIDTITFDKSINMFHDLNDLILIFYEKSQELKKPDANNTTKKIYLRSLIANKKTIRKRYK